jgi:hypothetical protein
MTDAPSPVAKYNDAPFSSSKTSNWVARRGGLPPHVRAVARALMRDHGMDESHAIAVAINANKRWASSGKVRGGGANRVGGGGGHVTPRVRALSSAAVAQWSAMKGVKKVLTDRDSVLKSVDDNWDYLTVEIAKAMTEVNPWPTSL